MRLYQYKLGVETQLAAAQDDEDAYERRAEVNPVFAFTPVEISEVSVDGYEITLKPTAEQTELDLGKPTRKKRVEG